MINFIISFFKLLRLLIRKRHFDVVFLAPQYFNRGNGGENPYFKPMINLCKEHKLKYVLFEEPVNSTNHSHNKCSIPLDLISWVIIVLRKFYSFKDVGKLYEIDQKIGRCLRKTMFRNLYFDVYITISNSLLGVFRGLNENASLFDCQHGILYSYHWGYFKNGIPKESHVVNNVNFFLWGKLFYKVMCNADKTDFYKKKSIVLGTNHIKKFENKYRGFNKIFLITLTFCDFKKSDAYMFDNLKSFFDDNYEYFESENLQFIMKPHPRDTGYINLSYFKKYEFIKFCKSPLEELLLECSVHITFESSSVFEAAYYGVPSLIWPNEFRDIYLNEFQYPIARAVIDSIKGYCRSLKLFNDDRISVINWGSECISQFDPQMFLSAIKK